MSFKSSILENAYYPPLDVSAEMNYRNLWVKGFMQKLSAAGFVQKGDSGQYQPFKTPFAVGNSITNTVTQEPRYAFDNVSTNGTGHRSAVLPTVGNPVRVAIDVGTDIGTFQALSVVIHTYTNAYDPKTYKIFGSNDVAMDIFDFVNNPGSYSTTEIKKATSHDPLDALPTSNSSAVNLDTTTGYRYYLFEFSDTQNIATATYIQIPEIGLYTAASAGGTRLATFAITGPSTNTNAQTSNFQIWGFNDYGQTHGFPFYLKFWWGGGTWGGAPNPYIQGGTVTDGAGNFVGSSQTSLVRNLGSMNTNNLPNQQRFMCCGNMEDADAATSDARFWANYFYNNAGTGLCWSVERSKNDDGTDDYSSENAAVYINMYDWSGFKYGLKIPRYGFVPAPSTGSGILLDADGTSSSIRGRKIAVEPHYPFLGPRQYPLLNTLGYWKTEASAESIVTSEQYGVEHDYIAFGANYAAADARATSGIGILGRYE